MRIAPPVHLSGEGARGAGCGARDAGGETGLEGSSNLGVGGGVALRAAGVRGATLGNERMGRTGAGWIGESLGVVLGGIGEMNSREKGSRLNGARRDAGLTDCRGREMSGATGATGCTGAAKVGCDKSIG
jgi:hypothetical protein